MRFPNLEHWCPSYSEEETRLLIWNRCAAVQLSGGRVSSPLGIGRSAGTAGQLDCIRDYLHRIRDSGTGLIIPADESSGGMSPTLLGAADGLSARRLEPENATSR
ncbi:MAG: hypothetical protein ABSH37_00105 [Bryobacteraceae bacterium]